MPSLGDFKVLTFDCYGTLIDWESGILTALGNLTRRLPGWTNEEILEAHARYLADNPSASVTLEGHTDERGTREYNMGLGESRSVVAESKQNRPSQHGPAPVLRIGFYGPSVSAPGRF